MKTKLTGIILAVCLVISMGLAGCAEKVELAGLQVSGSIPVLAVGGSAPVELEYSFSKEAPTEEEIAAVLAQITLAWASSDETVATVDKNGTVTAVAPGSATITVSTAVPGSTSGEGVYSATVDVTVLIPLENATVQNELTLDLLAGETAMLNVEIQPADATNTAITYTSSDEAVATVDASGKVAPVAEGEATITATVTGDGLDDSVEKTLTTKVTVALLPQGITLESTEGLLYVGSSTRLEPHTLPVEAPASTYTYKSSDEAVATVDENGSIKAVAPGEATITVTSAEGHTAEYALTVTWPPKPKQTGNAAAGSAGAGAPADGSGTPAAHPPADGGTPPPPPDDGGGGGNGGGSGTPANPGGDGSPDNPIDGGSGPGEGTPGIGPF